MPEVINSTLIHKDEPLSWTLSEVTHDDCGQTFVLAETYDKNMGISGDLESITRFADTLREAVDKYRKEHPWLM